MLTTQWGAGRASRSLLKVLAAGALATFASGAMADADCHVGVYRLGDGRVVDIAPSEGPTLRWRMFDGETGALALQPNGSWISTFGWTGRPDGRKISFSGCGGGLLNFDGMSGERIPLKVTETSLEDHGVKLLGRLLLPPGQGRVPILVLLHGAEHDSAREFNFLQRLLPAEGVGAFVYDKRGTGGSGGQYTQDYPTLAADAVAALKEARRLAGPRAGRLGYQGPSQGGWVAPLAAKSAAVDFVIVSFGLAVSPLAEERESIEHDVRSHVPGAAGVRAAADFADAIEQVATSNFREGFDRLAFVRQRYGREPWFKHIGGGFARFLLDTPDAEIRVEGPPLINGINLNYDPMPVLRSLNVPQLWVIGGKDRDAAPYETARRLRQLRSAGRPITVIIYPQAEHGMTEFEMRDGERISTRYSPGYFRMLRDFALHGSLKTQHGTAAINKTL
jgi:pimeloyl-ACP methyl ester carboxylesterase